MRKTLLSRYRLAAALVLLAGMSSVGHSGELPRFIMGDLKYEGAFRVPAGEFGASNMNFAQGPIEYNAANHSLLMVGHSHEQAIAEFLIPPLAKSSTLSGLQMAADPIQGFSQVLGRATLGNTQNINRIGGLNLLSDGRLIVNAYEYYDAPADNSHTTLVLDSGEDIENATVYGYLEFQGGAGHTSGWMSPVPNAWQSALGGSSITGQSSGIPIISRTSVGPSAFAFDANAVPSDDSQPVIPTVKLLDFSLANPLHEDLSNDSGTNSLWTHLSQAVFGMVVPGTRTYLTLGHSGGHSSGVCYKCTQDDGNLCGGYCPRIAADEYQYYWLWDLNDLVAVREGSLESHAVRPYAYGSMASPFSAGKFGGGTFDPSTGLLYLSVDRADREQGTYSNPPVVVAYSFVIGGIDALFADGFE